MTLPKPILTILRRLLLGFALLVLVWLAITVFFALKPLPPAADEADRYSNDGIATSVPSPHDVASAAHDEKHCKQSLPVFWKQFRAAVLKDDWEAVGG